MTDKAFAAGEPGYRIRPFEQADVTRLFESFAQHGWHKSVETFRGYLDDQRHGARACYIADVGGAVAGYCTLLWKSTYQPFNAAGIPEIADLNVLPPYRQRGVGTALLDAVESAAGARSAVVGLGVGLYADYGAAQRLYVRRGYLPDGCGVMYEYRTVEPCRSIPIDDNATLMMTRALKN
ncbi:N-acetyltransferase [Flexivirga endophytica]|uniref:N-acetyltransferase n=1 Tax=Flexivirga endophytica TaxID=1849103 RepID=A0A916TI61_9MICO|nr:GNAT family N-acetyltransferase [Flexivirga endophytica]GGB46065.1 N-acetyltransferase [Flexivirga endophytica]GHB69835.1 N-acetyltransferase [Flexivirga endophytica]